MPSNQRKIKLGFKESYANEYNKDFKNFVSKDNIQNNSGRPMTVANDKLFVENKFGINEFQRVGIFECFLF